MVAKTNAEIYVLIIIKIYSYFSFVFSVIENIESDVATLKILTTMQKS